MSDTREPDSRVRDDVTASLIKRIAEGLSANRPGYFVKLQPGVTNAELELFEQRFSLQLPAAFRALYKWKNGQPASCSESLQGNRMFSPLEAVAESGSTWDKQLSSFPSVNQGLSLVPVLNFAQRICACKEAEPDREVACRRRFRTAPGTR